MTKLEDTVNEILGIDVPEVKENKEFTPTITRVEEKAKMMWITIIRIVENITIT